MMFARTGIALFIIMRAKAMATVCDLFCRLYWMSGDT
jgi:hypothetical protein